MNGFKKLLPYLGGITLLLMAVGAWADIKVDLSKLDVIGDMQVRQDLQWALLMINHENHRKHFPECRAWSEDISEAWRVVESRNGRQ